MLSSQTKPPSRSASTVLVDPNSHQRRMHKRKPFEKRVVLLSPKLEVLDTAMLIDISSGGACLRLDAEQWQHIPANFMMLITPNGAVRRLCKMIWRENRKIGIEFTKPEKKKQSPPEDASSPQTGQANRRPVASGTPPTSKLFISSK